MGQEDTRQDQSIDGKILESRLKSRYFDILDQIEKDYVFFAPIFFNMGYPFFTTDKLDCQTSKIQLDKITDDIIYVWNIDFYDGLSDNEVKFIIAHETFHILLDHIRGLEGITRPELYNLACDAVINDLLVKHFNFPLPDNLITGEFLIGENCADRSAEYVYYKILENGITVPNNIRVIDGQIYKDRDSKSQQENENSEGKSKPIKLADDHRDWSEEMADEVASRNAFEYDDEKRIIQSRGLEAGNSSLKIKHIKNPFSLRKLIKHIIGRKIEEEHVEHWRKYNYKLASIYPDIILPYQDFNNTKGKLSLLFCLDTSGSISNQIIQEFIAIAKNHRNDFDVQCIMFDTKIYPLDLETDKMAWGRGGTSFDAVAKWVIKQDENSFDVIFVLTDSYGGEIYSCKTNPKKWFWVITPGGKKIPPYMGQSHFIPQEYLKNNYKSNYQLKKGYLKYATS